MQVKQIFTVIEKLAKKNNTPIYAVGGFVRDFLLDKKDFKDIDFVVEGSGVEFAQKFDEAMKEEGRLVVFEEFDTARYLFFKESSCHSELVSESHGILKQVQNDSSAGVQNDRNNESYSYIEDKEIILELEFAGARTEKYDKKSRKPVVEPTTLEQDLQRRDFTVNAMALPVSECVSLSKKSIDAIIDPFAGQKDLEQKTLRTPKEADATFIDDPLRMMRCVRFAAQLNFSIDESTLKAIFTNKARLKIVSAERITEELLKIMATVEPSIALNLMFQTHLLDLVLPEVAQLDGVEEIYGHQHKNNLVHTFKVVDNVATRSDKVLLRLAALLHDIGKFETKKFLPKTGWTFYQHEHVGRKLVYRISRRLKLSKKQTDYLATIVRWHQQPISLMDDGITDSAVRRLIVNLQDDLDDLLTLGVSDITTGNPYKLKKRQKNYECLRQRIEEVNEKDELRAFQSPVRGEEIMKLCGLKPGPTIGKIKYAIEEAILDGEIANEYESAKVYFKKIKDEFLKKAQDWEKK